MPFNALMTLTYWRIGQRIFEQEQRGNERASYGEQLVDQLARDLTARFGRGFSRANVFQMRQFYVASPTVQTPSGQSPVPSIVQALSGQLDISFPLSWSHYVRLLTVTDEKAGLLRAGGATGRLVCEGTGSPAATKAYQRLRGRAGRSAIASSAKELNLGMTSPS